MALQVLIRRAVGAVWTYFCREWDSDDLWSSQVIGPALLNHLKLVYSLLICVSLSSAFGSYLCLTGTIESSVAILGAFVNTLCFYFVAPRNQNARLCLFIFGAIFGGAIVAPWMTRFLNVDTRFVVFSLSSSSVVLGSYLKVCKLMNHYTTWRKIWPSSFLLGFLPTMIWLPIVSFVIGGDVSRLKSQLLGSTFCFWWYVSGYTQEIMLKARRGDDNYLKHAITFFTDSPGVIFHIFLVILWHNIHTSLEAFSAAHADFNEWMRSVL